MTYQAGDRFWAPGRFVLPYLFGRSGVINVATATDTVAPTANRAYYLAFTAPYTGGVATLSFWANASSQNYDLGVYDASGNQLGHSGATAISGAPALQTWTPTNPIPMRGGVLYYAAISLASATSTLTALSGNATLISDRQAMIQATAHPLPSTATFAAVTASTELPILAITFV